jgi:hypothetical protein
VVLWLGGWARRLTTPHRENVSLLRNIHRDHWGDPGVDGRIILRQIFRKWDVGVWTALSWLRIETGGGHL